MQPTQLTLNSSALQTVLSYILCMSKNLCPVCSLKKEDFIYFTALPLLRVWQGDLVFKTWSILF